MITEAVADSETDRPPAGFRPLLGRAEVEMVAGPFYERRTADGQCQLGFRVTPRKLNRMGVCHGGVLAVFADIQGSALKKSLDLVAESPTVTLGIDYAAPAHAGAWVQSQPELVRQTATLLFFHALFYADDTLCARASGIYYLSSRRSDV